MDSLLLGLIAGSFVSMGAYSVLIGENPLSKFTENLYMGILSGYILTTNWNYFRNNAVSKVMTGQFVYIIAIVASLLLLARLSENLKWLARYPIAITVGTGLGLALRTSITSDFLLQITATIKPLTSIDNIFMVVGTASVAAYFIFTREMEGAFQYVHKTGRVFLLAAFGVTYGQTVSFRFELVIGRLVEMLRPEVVNYTWVMLALIVIGLVIGYKTDRIKWYASR